MPISEEVAQLAECDACGVRRWAVTGDVIIGVVGTLSIAENTGGYTVKFYSCSIEITHLMLAMENAQLNQKVFVERYSSSSDEKSSPSMFRTIENSVPKRTSTSNVTMDEELRADLVKLWKRLGSRPSLTCTKKYLHVGEKRAKYLLDSVDETMLAENS